jgi:hypothetical protein
MVLLQPHALCGSGDKTKAIEYHAAHDFGTVPTDVGARSNLAGVNDEPPLLIPSVPVNMAYTAPERCPPITDRAAQVVNIPAMVALINATSADGEQLSDATPPIANLELNL